MSLELPDRGWRVLLVNLVMADNLTPEARSYCMSRVRNKGTDLERIVCSALHRCGLRFKKNVKALAGSPDIVFMSARVAVFIDGDFWHGYRFPAWQYSVSDFWRKKIALNRQRDQRNFRRLRSMGWRVLRVWQHQIEKDLESVVVRIAKVVRERSSS